MLVSVVAVAALTLALALVGECPAAAQTDNRVTVAVLNFDMSNVRQWWSWHWDVSADMSGLVSEALVGKGNFRVLERSQIQSILAEQDFGHSGRVDESQAVEIGRLLGARLLIFGTITAFDYASTGGIQIFGVGLSGSKAVTELSGRIVDALTGEILGSVTGYGEESGTTFSLNTYRGLSFASREFQNSTVGKSVQQAVDSFASAAAGKINEVAANLAAEAQGGAHRRGGSHHRRGRGYQHRVECGSEGRPADGSVPSDLHPRADGSGARACGHDADHQRGSECVHRADGVGGRGAGGRPGVV